MPLSLIILWADVNRATPTQMQLNFNIVKLSPELKIRQKIDDDK